ncbi:hypothetical protein CSUI_010609 [Cystoisospora suis]|uniref:Uncharacterized protein n=1 Tax=Cystoisospora suis TaxID=483139 RepID=A0A2C6KEL6_9APIC|nr:hypothetical protein CSUI_010609 [Cystoisospora suis]
MGLVTCLRKPNTSFRMGPPYREGYDAYGGMVCLTSATYSTGSLTFAGVCSSMAAPQWWGQLVSSVKSLYQSYTCASAFAARSSDVTLFLRLPLSATTAAAASSSCCSETPSPKRSNCTSSNFLFNFSICRIVCRSHRLLVTSSGTVTRPQIVGSVRVSQEMVCHTLSG